ncbi:MAG TPA: hypothetical protein VF533_19870 [Solirubrobacteraceae bacterium]
MEERVAQAYQRACAYGVRPAARRKGHNSGSVPTMYIDEVGSAVFLRASQRSEDGSYGGSRILRSALADFSKRSGEFADSGCLDAALYGVLSEEGLRQPPEAIHVEMIRDRIESSTREPEKHGESSGTRAGISWDEIPDDRIGGPGQLKPARLRKALLLVACGPGGHAEAVGSAVVPHAWSADGKETSFGLLARKLDIEGLTTRPVISRGVAWAGDDLFSTPELMSECLYPGDEPSLLLPFAARGIPAAFWMSHAPSVGAWRELTDLNTLIVNDPLLRHRADEIEADVAVDPDGLAFLRFSTGPGSQYHLRTSVDPADGECLARTALEVVRTRSRSVAIDGVCERILAGEALCLGVRTLAALSLRLDVDLMARMINEPADDRPPPSLRR